MNVKDIISKLFKGETLTEDEKNLMSKFDYDAELNSTAAAARRKAEDEAKEYRAKLEKLEAEAAENQRKAEEAARNRMTADEKRDADFKALNDKILALQKDNEEKAARAKALQRSKDIDDLRERAGIRFISKIDPSITQSAFAKVFDGLEDLSDANEVKTRIEAFKNANAGLIADNTGRGSGSGGSPFGGDTDNPWAEGSFNVTKQAEIELSNPALAREYKARAGK